MKQTSYRFDTLTLGGGQIGIGPLPGGGGDLADDLAQIVAFDPALVVSMTTTAEMSAHHAQTLPDGLGRAGIGWAHFPAPDFGLPDAGTPAETEARWQAIALRAHRILAGAGRVFLHCRAGRGRSGMVALRLMIEAGETPDAALARLRAARPGAVETTAQMHWASAGAHRG